jgi:hypothetical protein
MEMAVPPFRELLAGCQRSALHLELRDLYADPAEETRFQAWQEGHREDPDDPASWWRPFHSLVQEAVARGVAIRRARIVSEPVTDYTRWLHSFTFQNLQAGEQVAWLPRRRASDLCLPGNDFWLFDERLIRWGHFAGDGTFLDHELSDTPAAAKLCAASFEAVWERAIPHQDYELR